MTRTYVLNSLALILLLLLGACSQAKHQSPTARNNDLKDRGLSGRVKSLAERAYYDTKDDSGRLEVGDLMRDSIVFNEAGYILEHFSEEDQGDEARADEIPREGLYAQGYRYRRVYRLNTLHLPLEEHFYIADTLFTREVYFYNDAGQLIQETSYSSKGEIRKERRMLYDEAGLLIRMEILNTREDFLSLTEHKYNAQGLLIETLQPNPKGGYYSRTVLDYDARGNLIGQTIYDDKGAEPIASMHWAYDAQGRKIKFESTSEAPSLDGLITYAYDDDGRLSVEEKQMSGNTIRTTYRYDPRGNCIETHERRSRSAIRDVRETWEYTYDEQGNWTHCINTIWEDGLKSSRLIRLRHILYY